MEGEKMLRYDAREVPGAGVTTKMPMLPTSEFVSQVILADFQFGAGVTTTYHIRAGRDSYTRSVSTDSAAPL